MHTNERPIPLKHPSLFYHLGIDVGGTDIKAIILSSEQQIIEKSKRPSRAAEGPDAVVQAIIETIQLLLSNPSMSESLDRTNPSRTSLPGPDSTHTRLRKKNIVSIGIGCAGSVDTARGIVINSPNFSNWHNIPLASRVNEIAGITTLIFNDANCATVAEWRLGAARGFDNVVLLTFGTGIGGGVIINGHPYTGATGTASELGHISIRYDGIPCPCGNTGCFERYCSASALKRLFPDYSAQDVFAFATTDSVLTPPAIIEASKNAIEEFMVALKVGLTSIANAFDPQCILLGGGLAGTFPKFLPQISSWVRSHAFPVVGQSLEIRLCNLDNWAGAIGAAILCATGNMGDISDREHG
jgi:glucokinase